MKLTKYGRKQWLAATMLLLAVLVCSGVLMFFSLPGGCILFVTAFAAWGVFIALFRDPHRVIGQDKTELVAPADGVVEDIELIPNASCEDEVLQKLFSGYDILRIGIVQSVFDVHIHRAPCEMTVVLKESRQKSARNKEENNKESREEDSFLLLGATGRIEETQFPVAVRQISHSSLKNIVCRAEEGDKLKKGARYGMIRFSSRTELYLPAKTPVSITANTGERVFAGKTVLAVFSRKNTD